MDIGAARVAPVLPRSGAAALGVAPSPIAVAPRGRVEALGTATVAVPSPTVTVRPLGVPVVGQVVFPWPAVPVDRPVETVGPTTLTAVEFRRPMVRRVAGRPTRPPTLETADAVIARPQPGTFPLPVRLGLYAVFHAVFPHTPAKVVLVAVPRGPEKRRLANETDVGRPPTRREEPVNAGRARTPLHVPRPPVTRVAVVGDVPPLVPAVPATQAGTVAAHAVARAFFPPTVAVVAAPPTEETALAVAELDAVLRPT